MTNYITKLMKSYSSEYCLRTRKADPTVSQPLDCEKLVLDNVNIKMAYCYFRVFYRTTTVVKYFPANWSQNACLRPKNRRKIGATYKKPLSTLLYL